MKAVTLTCDLCGTSMIPNPAEIEAARTPAGGWTREQLAKWGVRWPPPKGWKRQLEQRDERDDEHAA